MRPPHHFSLTVAFLVGVCVVTLGLPGTAFGAPPPVPFPSWWKGTCDNQRNKQTAAFHEVGSWDGLIACGPENEFVLETGPLSGQYEWQCPELVKRYLYQDFNLPVLLSNGDATASTYATYIAKHPAKDYPFSYHTPSSPGPIGPGDVISYAQGKTAVAGGHTAVVTSATATSYTVLSENAPTSVTISIVKGIPQPFSGEPVAGWLHYTGGAAEAPAMVQRSDGETDVVAQGPNNSLTFYWNALGSAVWRSMPIAGANSTYSAPAVIQRSGGATDGETDVVAEGPNNSLTFYWNAYGSTVWRSMPIAGANSTYSAPALVQRSDGETDVIAQGPNNSLTFCWNALGSTVWRSMPIAGANSTYSAPALVQRSDGETDVIAQGPNNSLTFYWNALGSTVWRSMPIAGANSNYSAPALVQRSSGETDVVAQGPSNSLTYYWNLLDSTVWHVIPVAAAGSTYSAPAVVQRSSGETDVVAQGPNNSLTYYWNIQGSAQWSSIPAAGAGSAYSAPAVVQRADGETDVAVDGPGGEYGFYWNTQNQTNWGYLPIN